ncbi:condensin complex subunit 2 [Prorops nasuta]|uniref:condensin complex subunit 2 n=1 Tax=Prorops nasuta TaxID=863751 RepID=UPI0034CDBE78
MNGQKNMAQVIIESREVGKNSSPLRRRSIAAQLAGGPITLSENDDEQERTQLRKEAVAVITPSLGSNRKSLGLGFLGQLSGPQIAERVTQCIKLNAENKINIKNAFSLDMIDLMAYMIKKRDTNMSNLQVASTSLDVSTKIYGYRVDGLHTEILKMAGVIDKTEQNQASNGENAENGMMDEAQKDNLEEKRKKKKKNKQKILVSPESLKTVVEVSSLSLGIDADLQTTDMLYQASLPNHANSGFVLHQFNDVLLDETPNVENTNESHVTFTPISDLSNLCICPSFTNFEFLNWNADSEEDEACTEEKEDRQFQFDLDASIQSDDGDRGTQMDYFSVQEEHSITDRCARNKNCTEKIVDLREMVSAPIFTKSSEYSFIHKSNIHWAGPSHWKIRHSERNLRSSRVEVAGQTKKKKELEVKFNVNEDEIDKKFAVGQNNRIRAKTTKQEWSTIDITLPEDFHYDITKEYRKMYMNPELVLRLNEREDMDATHVSDHVADYDYANENDVSNYCPDVNNDDYPASSDNEQNAAGFTNEDERAPDTQIGFTGTNLVEAPRIASKIFIPYSQRAKKIDMKELKKCIWTCINSVEGRDVNDVNDQDSQREKEEEEQFSNIYKTIPNMLTKKNAEALSFPIAFVALLHLANEKTLKINSLDNLSDIIEYEKIIDGVKLINFNLFDHQCLFSWGY